MLKYQKTSELDPWCIFNSTPRGRLTGPSPDRDTEIQVGTLDIWESLGGGQ